MKHRRWSALIATVGVLLLTGQDACVMTDEDGDGWSVEDGDCDDTNAEVYPTASEVCDAFDNNCDGIVDDFPCEWGSAVWGVASW